MTVWKPPAAIRVIAIGLAWNGPRLLAAKIRTSTGRVKGVRPLGGSIEFGETKEQALHREFMEELSCPIAIRGHWRVLENIFEHEGTAGHEIVFAANIELLDHSFYDKEHIETSLGKGVRGVAGWFDPRELATRGLELYPAGLNDLMSASAI